ncbi:uncharacterized protein [Anabrus simplex]|uniref:uncharacterized protein n=1 Tax=Anabrus simplex TaxID=316456 RepID=UPI0035A3B029
MAMYGQAINKRQKTAAREVPRNFDANEFFPGITKVEYKPDASPEDTLCFRYYNSNERIHGRAIEEWLRPAVSFWHAFRYSGADLWGQATLQRPWDDGTNSLENYKRRLRAAFEFYSKIGVKYWTFYDRDISPEGETMEETNHNLDEIIDLILELQQRTGVKPLWVAADLHSHSRYINGSLTSPDAQVVVFAAAQLKKSLEMAHKLGAECFLFRDVREGYGTILNTDVPREMRHYSRLLKMTADYKERLGYRGQLLLECQQDRHSEGYSRESYLKDATSMMCFLKHYSLDRHYKLSVVPGNQFFLATAYGMYGSIDATRGMCTSVDMKQGASYPSLYNTTLLMKAVIEQGGLQPGGLNIGVLPCRESVDLKDMFTMYVGCLDLYARGLRNAVKITAESIFTKNLQQRYLSFHTGFGSRLANGEVNLEDCEDQARKHHGDFTASSGRTEHWEMAFMRYM